MPIDLRDVLKNLYSQRKGLEHVDHVARSVAAGFGSGAASPEEDQSR
jgi:hypothetical protein